MDLVTTLLIAAAQVGVFTLVPLAWWLHAGRPDGSFLRWLGFRSVRGGSDLAVLAMVVVCGLGFLGAALLGEPASWAPRSTGPIALVVVPVTAVLQLALSEEIFFRGFLLRWLEEKRPGPFVANLVQASVCGAVRAAGSWLFIARALEPSLAALALGAGAAFIAGWLKQRTDSILLPWAAHGGGNMVAGLILVLSR